MTTMATHPDYLAMLAGVLEAPEDDAPRKVLADWLEENGEAERAEFIRVQVTLSAIDAYTQDEGPRPKGHSHWSRELQRGCDHCDALRRRERALLDNHHDSWIAPLQWPGGPYPWVRNRGEGLLAPYHVEFRRGFVAALTLTAEAFLAHADAVLWRRGDKECRRCRGEGSVLAGPGGQVVGMEPRKRCPTCRGTGHRPMPETAQPIESVRLTTEPQPLFQARGDSTVYRIRDGGKLWAIHDKAAVSWREILKGLLAAEWPQVKRENWKLPGD